LYNVNACKGAEYQWKISVGDSISSITIKGKLHWCKTRKE